MTNKQVVEIVNDFGAWGGNVYTLAVMIAQRQRDDYAFIAESNDAQAVADAIGAAQ